ncbi:hypothetical protein LUZ60_010313 [Juncus effusus]|nr:hypothetical protein LUZ60_010313 [Juncus effusus]
MFSGWFCSTPEPLPPINFTKRNKILEGAGANIKLLYKFLHEHANVTKQDEHLRESRMEAMFELLDDIKSRLEQTRIPDTHTKKETGKVEFRRWNSELCRSTHTIPSSSSTGSLKASPTVSVTDKHQTPLSASSSSTPPSPLSDKRPPPLSPKLQKHMSTPPVSPKPLCPPPLSLPPQSPLHDSDSNNDISILQENISNLKSKLATVTAARKRLENSCATIGRDNDALSVELARKNRELDEANEAVQQLTDINQRLYRKLSGEDVDCDVSAELVEMNKKLTDRIRKAAEDYKMIMKKVEEGISLDSRVASEMGSCIELLSQMRHERAMEERHDISKMEKILAKMEGYLVGCIENLVHSPLRNIE